MRWEARTKEGPNKHSNSPGSLGNVSHTPGRIGVSKTSAARWGTRATNRRCFVLRRWGACANLSAFRAKVFAKSKTPGLAASARQTIRSLPKRKVAAGCGRSPSKRRFPRSNPPQSTPKHNQTFGIQTQSPTQSPSTGPQRTFVSSKPPTNHHLSFNPPDSHDQTKPNPTHSYPQSAKPPINLPSARAESDRANIMDKLHMRSFSALMRYAIRNAIIRH